MKQPTCPTCDFEIKEKWNNCIMCGRKLKEESSVIDSIELNSEKFINHLKKESTYKR